MPSEPGREVQLRGKQLVFLFMASTVAVVVVFLCGVMVGRGIRGQLGGLEAARQTLSDPTADLLPPPPTQTGSTSSGASPAVNEDLSYPERLGAVNPPEVLSEPPPVAEAVDARPVRPAPEDGRSELRLADSSLGNPPGDGFAVQVGAIREQAEAERMAKRLVGRGYQAYVTVPAPGAPRVFRVRVGRFKERREAEAVARRLEKEEQFKPWVTR